VQKVLRDIHPLAAVEVEMGTRILAVSTKAPENPASFVVPKSEQTQVWFREMFEPTISVLPPRDILDHGETQELPRIAA
jgi:hypothetical protein